MFDRKVAAQITSAFAPAEIDAVVTDNLKSDSQQLGNCNFCQTAQAIVPYKKVIKATFKEKYLFVDGVGFCRECAFILLNPLFRRKNFVYNAGGFRTLQHSEVWEYLLAPITPPYFLSLTTSHKKHSIVYGEMNNTASPVRKVVFDQHFIQYSVRADAELFSSVHEAYNKYEQNKANIKTGEYRVAKLSEEAYRGLMMLDEKIKSYRGSMLFDLVLTYVQKETE